VSNVLYIGDSKTAWGISEQCVGSRHKIFISLLVEFIGESGKQVEIHYCLLSLDRWAV